MTYFTIGILILVAALVAMFVLLQKEKKKVEELQARYNDLDGKLHHQRQIKDRKIKAQRNDINRLHQMLEERTTLAHRRESELTEAYNRSGKIIEMLLENFEGLDDDIHISRSRAKTLFAV